MNAQQIKLNEGVIRHNRAEIAKIELELQNPRIRKVEQRKQIIASLQMQIEQAEQLLAEVVNYERA